LCGHNGSGVPDGIVAVEGLTSGTLLLEVELHPKVSSKNRLKINLDI